MEQEVSSLQEQGVLIVGGATLLSLGIRKARPHWAGIVLLAMGLVLLRSGLRWIRSQHDAEHRAIPSEPKPLFDS
jgi:hypothetical protein